MRAKDWSATALGPSRQWPRSLRTIVRTILTTRFSIWMGWGRELHMFYNDAYRPTLGGKHPATIGMPFFEVWKEIGPQLSPRIDAALRGEATWDEGLMLFLERNGYPEETYHTFSYSPLPDDDGNIGGMLCVVTEETDRVIGERRVGLVRDVAAELAGTKTDAQVFAAVARCLGGGNRDLPFALAYLFDEDGRAAQRLSCSGFDGAHPAAPERMPLDDAAPWPLASLLAGATTPLMIDLPPDAWPRGPWDVPPTRALLLPIAQQGQSRPAGAFIAALNPHRVFDDAYRDFMQLFVGQIAAGLANARAYEAERRRAEALADIDRAKTAFFSNVSHEFRTPLTLMLGPIAELVAEVAPGSSQHEQLALVHRNGLRLLKLVNTMLEFSRIEAGRVEATYEPTNLSQLTADLASVFRSATDKAGLQLVVDCPPLDEPVFVDRDMWEKIVFNLVSNAFKFTLAGQIAVTLHADGDDVRLVVRDSGSGIPAGELPHLFERFHRVEGTPGCTHEGTGIGLALVQELVKLHGGSITVASQVDAGSTFTVTIPRGRAHLPAGRIRAPMTPTASRHGNAYVEEALRWLPDEAQEGAVEAPLFSDPEARPRVLLADDNADMRQYIQRLLGARWDVDAVANGRQALEAVAYRRPDLVITDVMMPELDGFGLLRALAGDETTRTIPVLMLSARAGEESRMEALVAGANDYLVKPFAARELLARVDSLLMRSRIRAIEEAQARRLDEVFAQAPVAIAILSGPDHVFELANPPYIELLGNRALVGKTLLQAIPELHDQEIPAILDRVRETGEMFRARTLRTMLETNGVLEERFFDIVYQPMMQGSEVRSIAVVAFEVTELARARHLAELANRAKDEFLAMLSHELRNPLAPILTALQLMRLRGDIGGERERAVIERQVKHLVSMVDDLLDVSRVTRGKIELRRAPVELAMVVAQAIETASPLYEQQRHQLMVDVAAHGLVVDADAARLAQVIANLLTNAAKYTPNGGRVVVSARRLGESVELVVRDSGIGIEPQMLAEIFEPFAQERQALDRSQGGLGLGLAIVRSLVSLHGGTVAAASAGRDQGSQLTVTLPLSRATAAATTAAAASALKRVAGAKKILIVDDNEDAADLLAEMLEADQHQVRTAFDGPTALSVGAEFEPDIAILDIGLPVMDGFELATQFGVHPQLRRTRLIALTGYGQAEDRARSRAAGFAAHLVKPVESATLQAALQDAIARESDS